MFDLFYLAVTVVAAGAGYFLTRDFVARRLRFVDAVRSPLAPFVVAGVVALVVWPFALLPFVTPITAALTAICAGLGTASGVKAIRRQDLLPAPRR